MQIVHIISGLNCYAMNIYWATNKKFACNSCLRVETISLIYTFFKGWTINYVSVWSISILDCDHEDWGALNKWGTFFSDFSDKFSKIAAFNCTKALITQQNLNEVLIQVLECHVDKERGEIVATAARTRAVNWAPNSVSSSLNSVHNANHKNAIHMRKIYTGMYLCIYVNILRYVKRATSKVTLCSYEFIRQGYFSIDISIFLILVE